MNLNLERLELDGNHLGPLTALTIGELLKENVSLRAIDLEGNMLLKKEEKPKILE